MISPELIEIFNRAAHLARDGRLEESLVEYDRILEPSADRGNKERKLALTGEFLGVTMMRKAWVLMDLKRYKDAKKVFEDKVMEACLGQLEKDKVYDFFFSFGNTLGELCDIKGMDEQFTRALHIASKELGDEPRCFQCWTNLLTYAERAKAWEYLEVESSTAMVFAQNTEDAVLRVKASMHHILALKGLGRTAEAKEEAGVLMTYLREVGSIEALKDLEDLFVEQKMLKEPSGSEIPDERAAPSCVGKKKKVVTGSKKNEEKTKGNRLDPSP